MSETEILIGELRPVEMQGDVEATAKKILKAKGKDKESWNNTYRAELEDWGYRKYFITEKEIFKVEIARDDPYEDIYYATSNSDNTVSFVLKYYNGSCSFNEAMEAAIVKIKRKED